MFNISVIKGGRKVIRNVSVSFRFRELMSRALKCVGAGALPHLGTSPFFFIFLVLAVFFFFLRKIVIGIRTHVQKSEQILSIGHRMHTACNQHPHQAKEQNIPDPVPEYAMGFSPVTDRPSEGNHSFDC